MKIQFINRTRTTIPVVRIRSDLGKILSSVGGRKFKAVKFSSLALIFVSDAESRRLNLKFLKKNHPANVLSFNYGAEAELILAPGLIQKQARTRRRSYTDELRRMAVHGLLHLLGHHHEMSYDQGRRFGKLEQAVLKRLKIT